MVNPTGHHHLQPHQARSPQPQRLSWGLLGAIAAVAISPTPGLAVGANPAATAAPSQRLVQANQLLVEDVSLPDFDPAVNGFQFSNAELSRAIDVSRRQADWQIVLTDQLQQLFGTQVCVGESGGSNCVLTAPAQTWLNTQLALMQQGVCEGMAAASLQLWQPQPPVVIPWWQSLLNFILQRTVFQLVSNLFDLQTFIANLFFLQNVDEVYLPTQRIRDSFTPTQILQEIIKTLRTDPEDPYTMGLYRISDSRLVEGHTLTPYKVEPKPDGKVWVYVYDSNYPARRPNGPAVTYVEFDPSSDSWIYQPTGASTPYKGDASSKNLDLSKLSWRVPPESSSAPAAKGPFTCPFCAPPAAAAQAPGNDLEVALVGEGSLVVERLDAATNRYVSVLKEGFPTDPTLVPFKGGLDRQVPASYRLPDAANQQPLKITVTGNRLSQGGTATLQLTGPGYTASFERLTLEASDSLTFYLVPTATGPQITFVSGQNRVIPALAISVEDFSESYQFDSSTAAYFSQTSRQVSKSTRFQISGITLEADARVALAVDTDRQRFYFSDTAAVEKAYAITVKNVILLKDRIQLGQTQPDFLNYTLTYDEELRLANVALAPATQAYFDYQPALYDPGEKSRNQILDDLEARNIDVPIAFTGETPSHSAAGPLAFNFAPTIPSTERIYRGNLLLKSNVQPSR